MPETDDVPFPAALPQCGHGPRLGSKIAPHLAQRGTIPGGSGEKARTLRELVATAALEEGRSPEELVSPLAMLRLLYRRPETGEGVAATTGAGLRGKWVSAAGEMLRT